MPVTKEHADEKRALYIRAKDAYYNGKPIMSDAEFDKLENTLRKWHPGWGPLHTTGAPVPTKKAKTELHHYMPSLTKQYPAAMPKWIKAHPAKAYLVMDKLDGAALQVTYVGGKPIKVSTRGDGETGGDISFLIPELNLPPIKDAARMVLRCEALLTRKAFAKFSDQFENARNLVNGLLNRKKSEKASRVMPYVRIVVLGIYGYEVRAGLALAEKLGFHVVPHCVTTSLENISGVLAARKEKSPYEVDGLVVCSADARMIYHSNDKPTWITAFKDNVEVDAPKARVKRIIYQISKRGRIIPKIEISPVRLDGATVKFATCHNAKWMKTQGIGPGAVIRIVRSGGVIPKIVGVDKPGTFQAPSMPHRLEGVHFVLREGASAKHTGERDVQALKTFLRTLGVEFIAVKGIKTLFDAGCTTPFHYMKLAKTGNIAPMVHAGIGKANAQKIMAELQRVFTNTLLLKLMVASNLFGVGVGERRLRAIETSGCSMTRLLGMSNREAREYLLGLRGFKHATADVVIQGLTPFHKFLRTAERFITVVDKRPVKKGKSPRGPLVGQCISFTGYRSKDEEAAIEDAGGEVVPFGSKTTILLVRADGKASTKADKARERGAKVCGFNQLKI